MIKVLESNDPIRMSLERALPVFLGKEANVVVANIEKLGEVKPELERGIPVLFYGFESEVSLRRQGHTAVPFFYRKNTAYFQMPAELICMATAYRDILEGKKLENEAVILVSKVGYRKNLVGILLHDIHPGKYGCEKRLATAKREFGISGTIEEVRVQLEKLREHKAGPVKELIGDKIVSGVFCDVEGTLILDSLEGEPVNQEVLKQLEKYAKTKSVTLWTGGDLERIQKLLHAKNITQWPLVSKYDFDGCKVEIVIDDYEQKEFEERYKISSKKYIKT